jgi:hypothetical protein
MSEDRIFSLEEANALVPRLAALVGRLLERGGEIEALIQRVRSARPSAAARPTDLEPAPDDSRSLRADKMELMRRIAAYEEGWREVEALGAVVKDPRTGLCDFYGHVEGRLVCLCWRYGEPAIEHYHDLDAGYAGRKPIDTAARSRMLN